eukprot:jgi/Ulvmu1/1104/UM106_0021.1
MGVDYIARKAAKKRNKQARRGDHKGDQNARKERAARGVPKKRLGVCWGQPTLTEEDKLDAVEDAGDASQYDVLCGAGLGDPLLRPEMLESNRSKRLKATFHFQKNHGFDLLRPAALPQDADDPIATAKKPAKKERKALKLSTVVTPLRQEPAGGKDVPAPKASEDGTQGAAQSGTTAAQTSAMHGLHPVMQAYLVHQGLAEPTEVQRRVWSEACSGRDVVAQAPTGSGKTLAFVLPMAVQLIAAGHGHTTRPAGPAALAIAPTRELALQTLRAFVPLKRTAGLRSTCVYGGADRAAQIAALQHNPHALVATPGRLLDLYDAGAVPLGHVRCVALDECDKMLGLGFAPQLDRLAELLLREPAAATTSLNGGVGANRTGSAAVRPIAADVAPDITTKKRHRRVEDRTQLVPAADPAARPAADGASGSGSYRRPQVLLLSATATEGIGEGGVSGQEGGHANGASASGASVGDRGSAEVPESMRRWVAADAASVRVEGMSGASISDTITQVVHVCAEHKKVAKLVKHLQAVNAERVGARQLPLVLIFANRIKTVAYLHKELVAAGFKVEELHGQLDQAKREAALRAFRAGKVQVLVATDVAARGLHVQRLPYIVNYDFPGNLDTYIHRIGRTGRLKTHGHAFSFFTRNLARLAPATVQLLAECGQALDPNLVKLRDAFQTVVAKLGLETAAALMRGDATDAQGSGDGPLAGEDGAGASLHSESAAHSMDYPQDLREGVEVLLQGQKVKKKKNPKAQASSAAEAGEPLEQDLPDFIAAARFTGGRRGYVFTTRGRRTGYYRDGPACGGPGAGAGKVKPACGGPGAGAGKVKPACGGPGAGAGKVKPACGGPGAGAGKVKRKRPRAPAGETARDKPTAQRPVGRQAAHAAAAEPPKAARPLQMSRRRGGILGPPKTAVLAGDMHEGGSDSDASPRGSQQRPDAAPAKTSKSKALPGRLRKKLAKDKARA